MFDLVAIGDTAHDIFVILKKDEVSVHCSVDKKKCELCLNYAEKIPYDELKMIPAIGNAANVSVGGSRLGLNVGFYTVLSNDVWGKNSLDVLKSEGVSDLLIQFDSSPANLNIVLIYEGERTILVKHNPHEYKLPEFETKWIYFTSLAEGHENIHRSLPELIRSKGIKMIFNPGTPQMREGVKVLKPILEETELLIVNKQEAQKLMGSALDSPKDLLAGLVALGPKMAVVTDASNGSYATDGESYYKIGIYSVPVIERTGAGDAYSAGLVSALVSGLGLEEGMLWGTFNSSSVIQKVGSQEGLLTREDLDSLLEKNKDFRVEKF